MAFLWAAIRRTSRVDLVQLCTGLNAWQSLCAFAARCHCTIICLRSLALLWQICLRLFTDSASAIWASLRSRSKNEIDDGVAYGRQGWLRRRSVDSFFSAPLVR